MQRGIAKKLIEEVKEILKYTQLWEISGTILVLHIPKYMFTVSEESMISSVI